MVRELLLVPLFALMFALPTAFGDTVDITVRRAPYTVGGASSKSEKAWCPCTCRGPKTSYECKLDQQIECQRTCLWIKDKKQELESLRKEAR